MNAAIVGGMKKPHLVFRGKVFSVSRDLTVEPGGVRVVREIVRHPGSVVVIPQDAQGRLLLIRQYRYAARRKMWEVVAGRIDAGEKPLQAARRELAEEAGLGARSWTRLGRFYPSPGFMDEIMWLYLARNLYSASAPGDPDERISKRWFRPARVGRMIRRGLLWDSKSALCYFLLQDRGRSEERRVGKECRL